MKNTPLPCEASFVECVYVTSAKGYVLSITSEQSTDEPASLSIQSRD